MEPGKKQSRLAVIPARGGSKGVPRKNLRELAGRPLVAHTIACAKDAASVDRVVVSTDDPEIAAVAQRFGAEIVARPPELSGDTASSESAVVHALEVLAANAYEPDLVMLLQCTSPLTTPEDIDGAVRRLEATGADSCFTAVPFHHFLWRHGADGEAVGINHEGGPRKRRQDLDVQLLENGAVYVMRVAPFLREGTRFCGKTVIHRVDPSRVLEIDEPLDFTKAEALFRAIERDAATAALPVPPAAVVFDFDGVLTDNTVFVSEDGRESVRCDRSDGMGIGHLAAAGIPLLILSKERNPVVAARARKLGVEALQGIDDKLPALLSWLGARQLDPMRTIFVGNDVNDLACMRAVGFSACPADAHEEARRVARMILRARGGRGAVRELADRVLARLVEHPDDR